MSLETRGITVIATVGAIVGLLFGLVAAITGAPDFKFPNEARPWLLATLAVFTISAALGLVVNVPARYEEGDPKELRRLVVNPDGSLGDHWDDDEFVASMRVAELHVDMLESARSMNKSKARWLRSALFFEVSGIALLAITVSKVL